ncbi:hypothetical protein F8C76_00375 [Flagellimonas olearia]|uniref:Uncharacterized protein n=1 Tax=Flagellimonas olearia TaxID=552546 RepID=A0A6I1E2E6_9FLAO|nr:hypothetical protein [Allomuricauda olearia]KAB7530015.1 hypothetical protein F8C76_00375 [Allomuricauda olearia]
MEFSKEQLTLINSTNPKVGLSLEDRMVYAIFSLGKIVNEVVRLTLRNGRVLTGVFNIEELNGESNLDFSNPDDWTKVELNSIQVSVSAPRNLENSSVYFEQEVLYGLSKISKIEVLSE